VYHGASPHLARALRHARGADITPVTWAPVSRTAPEQFVSRVLTEAVVEALFAAVVGKRLGERPPHLDEVSRARRVQSGNDPDARAAAQPSPAG
jgi:hypothetical protein